jgi:mono/diheme cytochrome c family protein
MRMPGVTITAGAPKVIGIVAIALLIMGVIASGQNAPGTSAPSAPSTSLIYSVKGVDLYRAHCAACHGLHGKGDGPAAAAMKVMPPDLTLLSKSHGGQFPAAQVKKTISGDEVVASHGSPDMPIWGAIFHRIEYDQDLGDVRLVNLTKYLESIQQR